MKQCAVCARASCVVNNEAIFKPLFKVKDSEGYFDSSGDGRRCQSCKGDGVWG